VGQADLVFMMIFRYKKGHRQK